jgi:hypothetical protein
MKYAAHILTLAVLTAVGCGGPGYKTVPVSGRVTFNGEPMTKVVVLTQPIGGEDNPNPGPGSWGRTDEDGRFVLSTQDDLGIDGAIRGKCRLKLKDVMEQKASNDDTVDPRFRSRIPQEYIDGAVEFVIPDEGTDAMDFELGKKRR